MNKQNSYALNELKEATNEAKRLMSEYEITKKQLDEEIAEINKDEALHKELREKLVKEIEEAKKEQIMKDLSAKLEELVDYYKMAQQIKLDNFLNDENIKLILLRYPNLIPYMPDNNLLLDKLNNEAIPQLKKECIGLIIQEGTFTDEIIAEQKINEILENILNDDHLVCED